MKALQDGVGVGGSSQSKSLESFPGGVIDLVRAAIVDRHCNQRHCNLRHAQTPNHTRYLSATLVLILLLYNPESPHHRGSHSHGRT